VNALLDPSKQYFAWLGKIFEVNQDTQIEIDKFSLIDEFSLIATSARVWTIVWKEPTTNKDAAVLLSLLLLTEDEISSLAKRLLRETDLKVLLSNNLTLEKAIPMVLESSESSTIFGNKTYEFSGSIIEVMGQCADHQFESSCFLLNYYAGFTIPLRLFSISLEIMKYWIDNISHATKIPTVRCGCFWKPGLIPIS
jgi:hypothetical protein